MKKTTFALFAIIAGLTVPAAAGRQTPQCRLHPCRRSGLRRPGLPESTVENPTPNMDRLASQGIRFDGRHDPTSVCTPTRYSILTGRYSWRKPIEARRAGRIQLSLDRGRATHGAGDAPPAGLRHGLHRQVAPGPRLATEEGRPPPPPRTIRSSIPTAGSAMAKESLIDLPNPSAVDRVRGLRLLLRHLRLAGHAALCTD